MSSGRDTFTWSWQDDAPCKHKTELFYAPYAERAPARRIRITKAVSICDTCPFIKPCDDEANARNEQHGIWGGTPRGAEPKLPRSDDGRKKKRSA